MADRKTCSLVTLRATINSSTRSRNALSDKPELSPEYFKSRITGTIFCLQSTSAIGLVSGIIDDSSDDSELSPSASILTSNTVEFNVEDRAKCFALERNVADREASSTKSFDIC